MKSEDDMDTLEDFNLSSELENTFSVSTSGVPRFMTDYVDKAVRCSG